MPNSIFFCRKCKKQLRFPFRENLIKFKCPECQEYYEALKGEIINNPVVPNVEVEHDEVDHDINQGNEGDLNGQDSSQTHSQARKYNYWKIVATVLFIVVVVESFLWAYQSMRTYAKFEVVNSFLKDLKNHPNADFEKAKLYLTPAAKKKFEMYIEYAYKVNDSASMAQIDNFIAELKVPTFSESRKLYYINANHDTSYFHLDIIPQGNQISLNFDPGVFIK